MQLKTSVAEEEFIINNSYLNLCVEMIQHSPDISNAICDSSRIILMQMEKEIVAISLLTFNIQ